MKNPTHMTYLFSALLCQVFGKDIGAVWPLELFQKKEANEKYLRGIQNNSDTAKWHGEDQANKVEEINRQFESESLSLDDYIRKAIQAGLKVQTHKKMIAVSGNRNGLRLSLNIREDDFDCGNQYLWFVVEEDQHRIIEIGFWQEDIIYPFKLFAHPKVAEYPELKKIVDSILAVDRAMNSSSISRAISLWHTCRS